MKTKLADSNVARTRAEKALLQAFRKLNSKHERHAVLVVTTSIAWGALGKGADKKKLPFLTGPF